MAASAFPHELRIQLSTYTQDAVRHGIACRNAVWVGKFDDLCAGFRVYAVAIGEPSFGIMGPFAVGLALFAMVFAGTVL